MPRVFGHMDGEPEDARFCKVARAMKTSEWWLSWVGRQESVKPPKAIKGTLKPRLLPKHVDAMTDEDFDRLAKSVHDQSRERRFQEAQAWCAYVHDESNKENTA